MIGWQVTGCRPPYDQEQIRILFSSGGLNYTEVGRADPCGIPIFAWHVPDIATTHGTIKLEWGDWDWSANVHPFTIYQDVPPPQPPTADAGPDQVVTEGAMVHLTGEGSSDPEGQPLTYRWVRTDPLTEYPITLHDSTSMTPSFRAPEVGVEPKVFSFRLTVTDTDGLTDDDTVKVTVNPGPPDLQSVNVLEGWFKTPVTLRGAHLDGCEVRFDDTLVATVPVRQTTEFTFYLPELTPGEYHISVASPVGSDTFDDVFVVLPVPYQWDWGFSFHNPSEYDLSWADYERAFGTDAVYSSLCCEHEGLHCQRRCHRWLAQLLFDHYVRTMTRIGTCWGMSVASLKYYYGDYTLSPGQEVRHLSFSLDPDNELARRIKALHITQLSAEAIDYLLDHLADTPYMVAQQIMADLDAGQPGVIGFQNISEGVDLLDMEGHAVVPMHYEVVSPEEIRIYVYDSNREEFSMGRDINDPDVLARITQWSGMPYISVFNRPTERWRFQMADGEYWGGNERFQITVRVGDWEILEVPFSGFYYFPRSVAVRDGYRFPLSGRGILMILSGSADGEAQDAAGNRLGFDQAGMLHMEIAGGMPVVPMNGGSLRECEAYYLPATNLTVHAYGNGPGSYTWQAHGAAGSLAAVDVPTTAGEHDTFCTGPANDYLSFVAGGEKTFDLALEAQVQTGELTWSRRIELHGLNFLPGEQVIVRQGETPDALVVANLSPREKLLDLTITQAQLGPQPEPPEYPAAEEATLTTPAVSLPALASLELIPGDWDHLGKTELKIGQLPDRDGDGLDDAFEKRLGTDPTRADSDKDGMTDAWEFRYGLDPIIPAGESLDSDGDGLLDVEEARYGTDPGVPGGPFRIFHTAISPEGQLELRFNTEPGHVYQIEWAKAVPADQWTAAGAPITAKGWNALYQEPLPKGGGARFYRVRLVK
ncbi:MAG: hypothetical protein D6766_01275 [Verrucomicrobia bacterium]|nr:MAG: hypothetical protein D6766_01275 [Verrucomicrobiota bacterium]